MAASYSEISRTGATPIEVIPSGASSSRVTDVGAGSRRKPTFDDFDTDYNDIKVFTINEESFTISSDDLIFGINKFYVSTSNNTIIILPEISLGIIEIINQSGYTVSVYSS